MCSWDAILFWVLCGIGLAWLPSHIKEEVENFRHEMRHGSDEDD